MTVLVDERRAVDVVYLHFHKAFDTVFHKILTDKVLMYRPNEQIVRWTETD